MSQRTRILTEIWGYRGWKVVEVSFEGADGSEVVPISGHVPPGTAVVLRVARTWASRCATCNAIGGACHERLPARRWADLPMSGRPVFIEYAPIRVKCPRCGGRAVERLAWAEPHQRQSRRLQQHVAVDAFSMPLVHVATKYRLSWHTVRRAELDAIRRWELTRKAPALEVVGLDEKYLGRRNRRAERFVTIASNLGTGEPIWIGLGRREATVASFLATLEPATKSGIRVAAMDMHRPFANAIRADPALAHVVIVHDPFHVMKRAGEAMSELRKEVFFRAGAEMRRAGRGTRWLFLRSWERTTEPQKRELRRLFQLNGRLARAYQVVEELRAVLRAPDGPSIRTGLHRILRRTDKRANRPLRALHDSLKAHWNPIVALAEHRPPTGRIEAINNNWEALVRRGRGYRNLDYLLRKLRFISANPVRTGQAVRCFLDLGSAA